MSTCEAKAADVGSGPWLLLPAEVRSAALPRPVHRNRNVNSATTAVVKASDWYAHILPAAVPEKRSSRAGQRLRNVTVGFRNEKADAATVPEGPVGCRGMAGLSTATAIEATAGKTATACQRNLLKVWSCICNAIAQAYSFMFPVYEGHDLPY